MCVCVFNCRHFQINLRTTTHSLHPRIRLVLIAFEAFDWEIRIKGIRSRRIQMVNNKYNSHIINHVWHVSVFVSLRNLVVYPNGNKSRNVNEHLSLYLAMASSNRLQKRWEVHAVLRLFILDQNSENYMILQGSFWTISMTNFIV